MKGQRAIEHFNKVSEKLTTNDVRVKLLKL